MAALIDTYNAMVQRLPADLVRCEIMSCFPLQEELERATEKGDLAAIELIVQCGVNPATYANFALHRACVNGYVDVAKYLLGLPGMESPRDMDELMRDVSFHGCLEIIKVLSDRLPKNYLAYNAEPLCSALRGGQVETSAFLASILEIDLTDRYIPEFCQAAYEGDVNKLKLLLKIFPRINPAMDDNYPVCIAAAHGYISAVKFLMGWPGVDPTVRNNKAIRRAKVAGHHRMVEFLKTKGCRLPEMRA